jgi:hypothetical protein
MPEFSDRLINIKYRGNPVLHNGKGKVVPLHTLKAYEVEVSLHPFLTSTLDRSLVPIE